MSKCLRVWNFITTEVDQKKLRVGAKVRHVECPVGREISILLLACN